MAAPHQLAVRTQSGAFLRDGPAHVEPYMGGEEDGKKALRNSKADLVYSPDGTLLADIDADCVVVYDSQTGEERSKIAANGAAFASFSPQGTYVLTWEKLTEQLQQSGNLRVWRASTGEYLHGFAQKHCSRDAWPYVRWTDDEMVAAMAVTNGVHLFNGNDLTKGVIGKVSLERCASFAISPGPAPYKVVCFAPEVKDKPAQVKMFSYPNLSEPVSSKTMFRANDANFFWSPTGAACLIKVTTDVDATGKSYYGESKLTFVSGDGKTDGAVPLSKDGPIHDLAWSPSGKEFTVVYGFMPAKATLFDVKCKPIFDFGTGSRNTVLWSPHGRFMLLGGFGNIAGHLEFWDNNRKKQFAAVKAPGSTNYAWSPCSRFFMTATLFPRLRVDNGYKLFKYDGKLVHTFESKEEVYQVTFRPAKGGVYPDRPASPNAQQMGAGGKNEAADEPKKGAYVPPHLRGKEGEAPRKTFSLHDFEQAQKVGGAMPGVGGKSLPPGASEEDDKLSKSALKKKKAKEKAQKEKEAAEALEETQRALAAAGIDVAAAQPAAQADAPAGPKAYTSADEVQKRIKAVQKKLRQAESLAEEEKGGKELNVDQKGKIEGIGAMKEELADLDKELKKLS